MFELELVISLPIFTKIFKDVTTYRLMLEL